MNVICDKKQGTGANLDQSQGVNMKDLKTLNAQSTPKDGVSGGVSRRDLMKGAGAVAVATGVAGFPAILKASTGPIKIGVTTINSGRVAILGQTAVAGMNMVVREVNEAGGIDGRPLEIVVRDSKGKPDEASRMTRDLVNNEGCEILLNAEASGASFAVNETARDIKKFCIHSVSETSSLTADPKNRVDWVFRCARQGIHDAVGGGLYAAGIAKEKGLKKWGTCSPDYAYGRANTAEFMEYVMLFSEGVELSVESWPKIFQPDYTENISTLLNNMPDAMYSCLWGGDLVAFIDQASLYGLFEQFESFAVNLTDYPILTAVKQLPKGVNGGSRYHKDIPNTEANEAWYNKFMANNDVLPTNWSWANDSAMRFIVEALKETGGDTDHMKMAKATAGRTIKTPFGHDGELTMRGEDHTLVNYMVAYGKSVSKDPYMVDVKVSSWDDIYTHEADWKKRNNYS